MTYNEKEKKSSVIRKPIPLKKIYPKIKENKLGPRKFVIIYIVYIVFAIIILIILYILLKKKIESKTCPNGTIITMDGKGCTRIVVTEQYEGIISDNPKCNVGFTYSKKTNTCTKPRNEAERDLNVNDYDDYIEEQIIGCNNSEDILTTMPSTKKEKNPEIEADRCKIGDVKVCIKPCYSGYKMDIVKKQKPSLPEGEKYINAEYNTYNCNYDSKFCSNYEKFKGPSLEDPTNTCLFK